MDYAYLLDQCQQRDVIGRGGANTVGLFSSKPKLILSQIGEVDPPEGPNDWLNLVGTLGTHLLRIMPTEQDVWWFTVEQFDRSQSFCPPAKKIMQQNPLGLQEIEYEGRRSEESYVGAPNPGVVFLRHARSVLAERYNPDLADVVISNTYISYVTQCLKPIQNIRLKYAVHFHNNCISKGNFRESDEWEVVIRSLGGD